MAAMPLLALFFTKAVIVTDESEPDGNETADDNTSILDASNPRPLLFLEGIGVKF